MSYGLVGTIAAKFVTLTKPFMSKQMRESTSFFGTNQAKLAEEAILNQAPAWILPKKYGGRIELDSTYFLT